MDIEYICQFFSKLNIRLHKKGFCHTIIFNLYFSLVCLKNAQQNYQFSMECRHYSSIRELKTGTKKFSFYKNNSVILCWNITDSLFPIILLHQKSRSIIINSNYHFLDLNRRFFLKNTFSTFLCTTFYN